MCSTAQNARSAVGEALGRSHVVIGSIAPDEDGDPALKVHRADLESAGTHIKRLIYLSTTAVYGDQGGAWIDETAPLSPRSARARRRVAAEREWQALAEQIEVPLDILRLSGIYGPGRSAIENLRAGRARRIVKPGHVFNRIHVDDIVGVVAALVAADLVGAIYNLADDEPAPPQDVIAHAAELIGHAVPPQEDFASAEMSEMARSFYSESKRISNRRLKERLGLELRYPTYREGLAAIAASDNARETGK